MSTLENPSLDDDDDLAEVAHAPPADDRRWHFVESARDLPAHGWEVGKVWPGEYVKPTRIIEPQQPSFSAANLLQIIGVLGAIFVLVHLLRG